MAGNFLEQERLMYVAGDEAKAFDPIFCEGWDANNLRFIVGNRSRSLVEYSAYISSELQLTKKAIEEFSGIEKYGLYYLLNLFKERFGKAVWVDLGCGNAIAQRQAKEIFDRHGKIDHLKTVGYDALPFDYNDYYHRKEKSEKRIVFSFFSKYGESDLLDKYKPEIRIEDITSVKFTEAPHIVTCLQVLQWTTNPLEIFANAASQMEQGSVFCLTGLAKIKVKTDFGYYDLFDHLGCIPGFDNVYKTQTIGNIAKDPLVLVRNRDAVQDFTYGYKHLFASHDLYNGEVERSYTNYYIKA